MTNEGPIKENKDNNLVVNKLEADLKTEQENLVLKIENSFSSTNVEDVFDAISLIPKIINPIIKNRFEIGAYNFLFNILKYPSIESNSSIQLVLDAMKHVNFLTGIFRNRALLYASRAYEDIKSKHQRSKDLYKPSITEFLVGAEEVMTNLGNYDRNSIAEEDFENSAHVSNQEKIEWILFLLRAKNWPDISDGIKMFAQSRDKIFDKTPDVLIERIEEKIRDLILFGLNCKEQEPFEPRKGKSGDTQAKTRLVISQLQENALYANLMAVDLIQYAPIKFKKELVEVAKKNTHISDSVKENLDKIVN